MTPGLEREMAILALRGECLPALETTVAEIADFFQSFMIVIADPTWTTERQWARYAALYLQCAEWLADTWLVPLGDDLPPNISRCGYQHVVQSNAGPGYSGPRPR